VVHALVTVHEATLIEECERTQRFVPLPVTYLFVGPRDSSLVPPDVDVIVARDHSPNYEDRPSFYDFTGWFAAARHGLLPADPFLVCLQYDMRVQHPRLMELVFDALVAGGPVAFTPGHQAAGNWMLGIKGFASRFNEGMAVKGVDPAGFPPFNEWPSTQGTAWRASDLVEFMEWFEPLFDVWRDDLWAGHLAERSVWAWMMTTGRPASFLPGMIVHENRDVHGTCALMAGRSDVWEARSAAFGMVG
jgi:hypothetical protein